MPSLYRPIQSGFFTLRDGEKNRNPSPTFATLAKWRPDFAPWNSLSGEFKPLKRALRYSLVKLNQVPDLESVTPANYDTMDTASLSPAKMVLLN